MAETGLHGLARHARNVLDCEGAGILLECTDPTLRHPLLNFLPPPSPYMYYNGDRASSVADERLHALCDMALQSGYRRSIEYLLLNNGVPGSAMVVPLERPAGLLGLLLLFSNRPCAFGAGEMHILDQYAPFAARWLEEMLTSYCELPLDNPLAPNELVSIVSHEMRVPISAIKGYAVLLQAYGDGGSDPPRLSPAQRRQYLASIMSQVNALETLVNDLLDMSRLRNGHVRLNRDRINVTQICQEAARLLQHRVERLHPGCYRVYCDIDPHLPHAWADAHRTQQILLNLIENAIKYSPDGGLVEVLARAHLDSAGWKIHITVRDRGIGIPSQLQSALFKPFKRLNHSSHIHGNGLGLYIARQLVEAMSGQITLSSSEGQGTSVTFTLPCELPIRSTKPPLVGSKRDEG